MHVTVQPSDLAAALKLSVAAGRTILPILQHALLSARDGVLEMETTDLEIYVRTRVPAEVSTPGDALLFEPLLRPVAAGEGGIVFTDQRVSRGRSHYQIPRLPVGDFPRPERVQFQQLAGVDVAALRNAIAITHYAGDKDDAAHFARAVHVTPGAVFATDAKSAARVAVDFAGPTLSIPLAQVPRVLASMTDDATLSIGNVRGLRGQQRAGMLRVDSPGITVTVVLMEMPLPALDSVIPRLREGDARVQLDTAAFRNSLRRFLPFAALRGEHSAALSIERGELVMADLADDNREDLSAAVRDIAGTFRFGFDPKRLIDALVAIETDTVTLIKPGGDNKSPAVLIPEGCDIAEHVHLLAPRYV